MRSEGDVDAAFAGAARTVSVKYFVPYLAHAPMEVSNAVAHFAADTCKVWCPTQCPRRKRGRRSPGFWACRRPT